MAPSHTLHPTPAVAWITLCSSVTVTTKNASYLEVTLHGTLILQAELLVNSLGQAKNPLGEANPESQLHQHFYFIFSPVHHALPHPHPHPTKKAAGGMSLHPSDSKQTASYPGVTLNPGVLHLRKTQERNRIPFKQILFQFLSTWYNVS